MCLPVPVDYVMVMASSPLEDDINNVIGDMAGEREEDILTLDEIIMYDRFIREINQQNPVIITEIPMRRTFFTPIVGVDQMNLDLLNPRHVIDIPRFSVGDDEYYSDPSDSYEDDDEEYVTLLPGYFTTSPEDMPDLISSEEDYEMPD